jgi:predicted DsbA family dithiol-disulfide isomerase
MPKPAIISIAYFSDVLCLWAYVAQIKLDELHRHFGTQIRMDYHFLPLFGNVGGWIDHSWGSRGGMEAYAKHVKEMAKQFDHIEVHPDIWLRNTPPSSASCHLFLKAIQLLEQAGQISSEPQARHAGKTVFEAAMWRFRLGFFRDLQNIAERSTQAAIAAELDLPLDDIFQQIDSGQAFAALCADFSAKEKYLVEGSPTFLFPGGRQKLYGNVGYRIIEANIHELLTHSDDRASWC